MNEPFVKRRTFSPLQIIFLTTLALVAFAANSVLCRLALGEAAIDAASFTVIRLLAGAIVLWMILKFNRLPTGQKEKGSWSGGLMLFLYAVTFSFAYMTLETGTGALILFGSVQMTIIIVSLFWGNRLTMLEWIGVSTAFLGFVYLVFPDVTTPSVLGFGLMTTAGIAWALYTLKGRSSRDPLCDTTYNFMRTIPFVFILTLLAVFSSHYSTEGIILAVLSGGLASGIGYTIWYGALTGLSDTQAAVVQLSVPIIAAVGGVAFVGEAITLRLSVSGLMILGGILLVALGRRFTSHMRVEDNA